MRAAVAHAISAGRRSRLLLRPVRRSVRPEAPESEAVMLAIMATLKVQDGKADEFIAAAQEMVASVGREEAGKTVMYTLHRSRQDPNTFIFYEQYMDEDALAAHRGTGHMAAFGGKIRELLAGRPEIVQLDPVASLD
jgi:quinol monooxygenase YgiN